MIHDLKIAALAPRDDLHTEQGRSFEVYSKALDSAFGNPKIRNLALSGSLGSGKSSIIRSFDRQRNGTQRFLYVSLIDFTKAAQDGDNKAYDQKQLEYSLLSQIQSYCTYDAVPEGSIRGIPEKYKFLRLSAGLLSLLFLTAFVLIFHEKFGALAAMLGFSGKLRGDLHLLLYLFAALVLCGCTYCILRRCLPFLRVSKLLVKSSMAEAEVNLSKEQFSLDSHKFELAYILEQIGENHDHTVVFEDLERLEAATAISIMTKLRELNTLTNNHILTRKNARPIRFLYAIADSTMPAEYRTKFYDCIIPVIPVSHPLNSREKFQRMLENLKIKPEWVDHLCDALSDAFVDYRTLLSLQNEFQVLKALYETESKGTASASANNAPFLFAITAYRILLPEIFERTLSPQGDGILPDVSSREYLGFFGDVPIKTSDAVHKLFVSSLLDSTSMRLIVGEQALIDQWLKVIRSALDKEAFDKGDEMRIRSITAALQSVFRETNPNPSQEPYAFFRKVMAERLCTLTTEDNKIQFILTANSLAAVSRANEPMDWIWPLPAPEKFPVDFQGFLRNDLCWLEELSAAPELRDCPHTSNYLDNLCRENAKNPEVAFACAKDLVTLSCYLKLPTCNVAAQLMKSLYDAWPENDDIALSYSICLGNLSSVQDQEKRTITANLMRNLYAAYPEHQQIAACYAICLVNLSASKELSVRTEAVSCLQNVYEKYPENQKISHYYAEGLANLSNIQNLPERIHTISLLRALHTKHPEHHKIALEYARSLGNLSSCVQDPTALSNTVNQLERLCGAYPGHSDFDFYYAQSLVNLSANQEPDDCVKTTYRLKLLYDAHPKDAAIALSYACGLAHVSNVQELPEIIKTIALLKELWQTFPDNQEIALEYAKGLFNLSNEQDLPERTKTIELLKNLHQKYPDNQEIALAYADGLFNLSLVQEEDQISATMAEISDLLQAHPGIIPESRRNLDSYLSRHPSLKKLYHHLQQLFDAAVAEP